MNWAASSNVAKTLERTWMESMWSRAFCKLIKGQYEAAWADNCCRIPHPVIPKDEEPESGDTKASVGGEECSARQEKLERKKASYERESLRKPTIVLPFILMNVLLTNVRKQISILIFLDSGWSMAWLERMGFHRSFKVSIWSSLPGSVRRSDLHPEPWLISSWCPACPPAQGPSFAPLDDRRSTLDQLQQNQPATCRYW